MKYKLLEDITPHITAGIILENGKDGELLYNYRGAEITKILPHEIAIMLKLGMIEEVKEEEHHITDVEVGRLVDIRAQARREAIDEFYGELLKWVVTSIPERRAISAIRNKLLKSEEGGSEE